ncbi:MAG TPA: hypothetical protein VI146_04590, partial [Nitrososphaeraceae archaeon]
QDGICSTFKIGFYKLLTCRSLCQIESCKTQTFTSLNPKFLRNFYYEQYDYSNTITQKNLVTLTWLNIGGLGGI